MAYSDKEWDLIEARAKVIYGRKARALPYEFSSSEDRRYWESRAIEELETENRIPEYPNEI